MGSLHQPSAPDGPTGKLCSWIEGVALQDVPEAVVTRAKYLILDGIACAIFGAHLPWSETAAQSVISMEGPGRCNVIGHDKKIGPLAAALLNSTFLQGFELDDYHSDAPLHSNAILLPALLAAAEHLQIPVSGAEFLLSVIVGYEVGPRVGLGLYGGHILSLGWHSGAVFGPSAAAAAVSKLMRLQSDKIEDALGIACTQAGGLMSAQFESDVKRMQHGFASRNGLFAALMAKDGQYRGIKQVYERPYGGFLAAFGQGSGRDPPYLPEEVYKGLGESWQIKGIRPKAYAAMAGTHCTIDCIAALQKEYPSLSNLASIKHVKIEIRAEAAYKHGAWEPHRPLTATGAQMSNQYAAALQLVDGQVSPAQFSSSMLNRDILWELIGKMDCVLNEKLGGWWAQRVTISFEDDEMHPVSKLLSAPLGVDPELSNHEILQKWRLLVKDCIQDERRTQIENYVMNLDSSSSIEDLCQMLSGETSPSLT